MDVQPQYLKSIPKDLFTERPLIYRRTGKGYLLYSVGPNVTDDGGKDRRADPDADDIVVRVGSEEG